MGKLKSAFSGSLKIDVTVLREAVYHLRMMESHAQDINYALGSAIDKISNMAVKGNFNTKIISEAESAGAIGKASFSRPFLKEKEATEQVVLDVNQSLEKSATSNSVDSDSVTGLVRIALKMRDFCHIIEMTHQLISRTEMDMEETDAVIAKMALEMYLKNPELSAAEREYIEKHYDEVYTDTVKNITEDRLAQEKAVEDTFGEGQETVTIPTDDSEVK